MIKLIFRLSAFEGWVRLFEVWVRSFEVCECLFEVWVRLYEVRVSSFEVWVPSFEVWLIQPLALAGVFWQTSFFLFASLPSSAIARRDVPQKRSPKKPDRPNGQGLYPLLSAGALI